MQTARSIGAKAAWHRMRELVTIWYLFLAF